jgi:hypothetical protein
VPRCTVDGFHESFHLLIIAYDDLGDVLVVAAKYN